MDSSVALPSPPSTTAGHGAPAGAAGIPAPAGSAAGSSSEDHSLSFRVMRLARPEFKPSFSTLRCELNGNSVGEVTPHDGDGVDWSSTVQLGHPTEICDLGGSLVLPQSFGSIQLGETFSCYISLGNVSSKPVTNISIRVELQTERQRRNIFENTSKPLETLAPGQRYDFIIQHDVKELGTHTLVCSSVYTEGGTPRAESQVPGEAPTEGGAGTPQSGERKYLPQWYKFKVTNPFVVRMKVRTVSASLKQRTFVEACLENATSDPLLLDVVKFEQTEEYRLLDLDTGPCSEARPRATLDDPEKIGEYLEDLVLLKPRGGSYNFVFGLERSEGAAVAAGGGGGLGKLEIRWSKPMGDRGRLQTQQIQGVASHGKKSLIEARVTALEGRGDGGIRLHSCFSVTVRVTNLTDRTMYGVFVVLGLSEVMRNVGPSGVYFKEVPSGVPATAQGGSQHVDIAFDLIALKVGVHKLGTVMLYDERGKLVTETPCNFAVEVLPPEEGEEPAQGSIQRNDTMEVARSPTLDSLTFDSLIDL